MFHQRPLPPLTTCVKPGKVSFPILSRVSERPTDPPFLAWSDSDGKEWKLPDWTTVSEGAATIITGMIDPTIENSNGSFLHNNAVADEELTTYIDNVENWDKLWELSEKLIGESFLSE